MIKRNNNSHEYAKKFYTDLYKTISFSMPPIRKKRFEALDDLLCKYSPRAKKVLDFGGGDGRLYDFLSNKDAYYIIDVADSHEVSDSIDLDKRLKFRKDMSIPTEDGFFDVVVLSEVLEHIYDPLAALYEIARVLKKNGVLIVTVPNAYSLYYIVKTFFGKYIDPSYEHVHLFDYSTLASLARPAGFVLKKHFTEVFLYGKIYDSFLFWVDPVLSRVFKNNNIQLFTLFKKVEVIK